MWLRAVAAWKAGRPSDALAKLNSIRGEVPFQPWWHWFTPYMTYLKGEVLLQLGRDDEAARQFETVRSWEQFLVPRYRRLAQIEERRGNREKAIAYYKRVIEFWKDCDPELRPQLDESRARLAMLETRR
jgi:tetratricopeptide (TPR) repeat protein